MLRESSSGRGRMCSGGERENYWLGEGSSEGEKWSWVRDDGEEKGKRGGEDAWRDGRE